MLAGKISALKYFLNCFWDSVEGGTTRGTTALVYWQLHSSLYTVQVQYRVLRVHPTGLTQEAKYVERWPNTTSAWSRFDIPVDRYGGVHSLLICTSSPLGFATCHRASQQKNMYCTYSTKYQKADRASTLVTLWVWPSPGLYAGVHSPIILISAGLISGEIAIA